MPFYRHYSDYHLYGRDDGKRGKAHPEIIVYSEAKPLPNYKFGLITPIYIYMFLMGNWGCKHYKLQMKLKLYLSLLTVPTL